MSSGVRHPFHLRDETCLLILLPAAATTIGVVTAGVSISYIIFMLYFDWMPTWELSEMRQLSWSLLHYPLQLSMTMFVEGIAQLVLYWKCVENMAKQRAMVDVEYEKVFDKGTGISWPEVAKFMSAQVTTFTEQYEVKYTMTGQLIERNIEWIETFDSALPVEKTQMDLTSAINTIFISLENSLFQNYDVDFREDTLEHLNDTYLLEHFGNLTAIEKATAYEFDHATRIRERFQTVFQYTFICGGIFFAFSTILYMIARRKKWTPWAVSGIFMNFVLALGIGLLALIGKTTTTEITAATYIDEFFDNSPKPTAYDTFARSPYVLPVLLAVYVVVLLVTHMMGDGPRFSLFKSWKARERPASPAQQDVTQVYVHADTKYDPGAHYVGEHQQVPYDPYASQMQHHPSARPFSVLRTGDPEQYQHQPQGYVQQVYSQDGYQQPPQQQQQQQYTTVYEYSGNEGPRQP